MRIRTDDAATRVEFTFYDLPGEARWFQWVRFYIACIVGVPTVSFLLWLLGSLITSGPWLVIMSVLAGAAITVTGVVAALSVIGRYETPSTPLTYRMRQLRSELSAPRTPRPAAGEALSMPAWKPVKTAKPVHEPSMFGAPTDADYPTPDRADLDS